MATATVAAKTTKQSLPEQRIILRNVSWETYELLLADHVDRGVPRFAYDRGVLEIMGPSFEHERLNRLLASLVEMVALELAIEFVNAGSMTYKRREVKRGFEPDSSFYVQNESRVFDKQQIDASTDPPPDLVIEIDLSHSSMDKLPIYAALGVPEIWRYADKQITILRLVADDYEWVSASQVLPPLTGDVLNQLLAESRSTKRTAWLRMVQAWARSHVQASEESNQG